MPRPDRSQTARPSCLDLVLHLAVALFRRLVACLSSCSSLAEHSAKRLKSPTCMNADRYTQIPCRMHL